MNVLRLACFLLLVAGDGFAQPVAFSNTPVEQRVRAALQLPEDSINQDLLGTIEMLDLSDLELESLELPAGLSGLRILNLSHNRLQEVNLPPDVTSIVELDLG